MSKRVEVREGDKWTHFGGLLAQIRTDGERCVSARFIRPDEIMPWHPFEEHEASSQRAQTNVFGSMRAKMRVEGMGIEWAEVAEEKPATTYTKTLHVYEANQGSILFNTRQCQAWGAKYLGTTTITIAGVTT